MLLPLVSSCLPSLGRVGQSTVAARRRKNTLTRPPHKTGTFNNLYKRCDPTSAPDGAATARGPPSSACTGTRRIAPRARPSGARQRCAGAASVRPSAAGWCARRSRSNPCTDAPDGAPPPWGTQTRTRHRRKTTVSSTSGFQNAAGPAAAAAAAAVHESLRRTRSRASIGGRNLTSLRAPRVARTPPPLTSLRAPRVARTPETQPGGRQRRLMEACGARAAEQILNGGSPTSLRAPRVARTPPPLTSLRAPRVARTPPADARPHER